MNDAEILATTYFDTCLIERLSDRVNTDTGLTEQTYQPVYDEPIKCALSQSGLGSAGNLSVIDSTGMMNVTQEDQKLFTQPNIKILKGDRLTVTQQGGQMHVYYAKQPFFYPSHTEINVVGREIDGKK